MSINVTNQSHFLNVTDNTKGVVLTPVIALAAVGVVINLAAIAYLIYTPKIKRPLKVCLFNLVVSDCMFLSGMLMRAALYWNNTAAISVCPVFTILILLPSPVSYSAVLGLAGYNFIAVYKATEFNTILTTQKAVIITCLSWTVISVMAILSISLGGRSNTECSLLATAPPFILVLFAVHCLLCSFGMAALNVAVALKLRSARSVGSSHKARSLQHAVIIKETSYTKNSFQSPQLLSVPRPLFANDDRSFINVLSNSKNASFVSITQLRSGFLQQSIDVYSDHENSLLSNQFTETIPSRSLPDTVSQNTQDDSQTNKYNVQLVNRTSKSISNEENMICGSLSVQKSTTTSASKVIKEVPDVHYHKKTRAMNSVAENVRPFVSFESSNELSVKTVSEVRRFHLGSVFFSKESKSENNTERRDNKVTERNKSSDHEDVNVCRLVTPNMSKKIRTVMTLAILAFWNAVLTLPILGMWLWLATVKDARREASYQWVANVLPFLATFNSVSNPFLYAWRFVNWRRLYTTCCKRRRSASLAIGSLAQDSKYNSVLTK